VRDAALNLGYCRMYAPIDGRIGEALVKVGNLVGPDPTGGGSFTELAAIQQLDPMGVDILVSSRYLDRPTRLIEEGLTVRLFRPSRDGDRRRARRVPRGRSAEGGGPARRGRADVRGPEGHHAGPRRRRAGRRRGPAAHPARPPGPDRAGGPPSTGSPRVEG